MRLFFVHAARLEDASRQQTSTIQKIFPLFKERISSVFDTALTEHAFVGNEHKSSK